MNADQRLEMENKIKIWWKQTFPNKSFNTLTRFSGGQSHSSFLINNQLVLKIYESKHIASKNKSHFNSTKLYQQALNKVGISPKIIGIYEDDLILEGDAILMEFIKGQDLSVFLADFNQELKFSIGKQIGEILKIVNKSQVIDKLEYNSQELLSTVVNELDEAIAKKIIPENILTFSKNFISNYKPKIITDKQVLVHGDAHLENFIMKNSSLYLIDFDVSEITLSLFEARMLLHMAFMPANLVSEDLEKYYPEGSLVELLKGIIHTYPDLLPKKYLEEIKLLALYEILSKFNLDDSVFNKVTPVTRATFMFNQVFVADILQKLLK